jgi:glycosyltransferase involved in cell wall biosynthesis
MQAQTYFGADSQIHASIARHLDPERFRVIVACNRGVGSGSPALDAFSGIPGVLVIPTDFGPSRGDARSKLELALITLRRLPHLWSLARLAWFARTNRVDIVHGTEKPRDVISGFLVGRFAGAKTLTHVHIKMENWIHPLARWVMHRNDALVGVSAFVAQSAVNLGYPPTQIHHVLNGLEVERWNPDDVQCDYVRNAFGVADDVALIAIIARVFPWKGHEQLVRALARVRDQQLAFHLLIVGEDDTRATAGNVSHLERLRRVVDELDLGDHVTFTGFRADVPQLMKAIDVFAMPTYEEPFGMVFLEALAMRTPVVSLRSGGVVEFIDENVTGLLSDPYDEDQLVENLARLISDPDLRLRMGKAGRETVLSRHTSARMAADMADVYRTVLAGTPDSGAGDEA